MSHSAKYNTDFPRSSYYSVIVRTTGNIENVGEDFKINLALE